VPWKSPPTSTASQLSQINRKEVSRDDG
jgi:hypothetical protein